MASGIVESNQGSTQQQQQDGVPAQTPASPGNRSQIVQRLLDAPNLPAFITDLLTAQAVMVAGTEAAGFILEAAGAQPQADGDGAAPGQAVTLRTIAHIRPDNSSPDVRAQALAAFQDLIRPCLQQNRDGAIEVSPAMDGHEAQFCLVTLLRTEGQIVGISAVITRCLNVERAKQRLQSMQIVAGYFELFNLRRNAEQSRSIAQSHQHVLQLATAVATGEGYEAAAMSLCNELANRAHATRVSLGWIKGKNIKVRAISHTEEFDKKQELVVLLQKVMEECMDQEAIVQFDPNGKSSDNVTRNAQQLSRTQGGHTVLSLPLRRKGDVIGVVTVEFLPSTRITPQIANGLAIAVDLLAPQLWDRHENDRWLITKAGISTREVAKATIGPKHMIAKLIAIAVIGVVLFAVLYKPMYRVSSPFTFVPEVRYTLPAPYEGKLGDLTEVKDPFTGQTRRLKPGDAVKAGMVLVKMDTTDQELERDKAEADRRKAESEIRQYEADNSKPENAALARMAQFKMEEAAAQVALLDAQIARGSIRSPIDGVLLKGDLEDQKGKPFKQGEELLVVGQPDALEAELEVAERDIQDVQIGQKGSIATSSLPDEKHPITINRLVPIGSPNKEGQNVFKVYGTLQDHVATWRPGMAGEAKVEIRKEPVWWIYSHKVVEFVKLQAWKWGV